MENFSAVVGLVRFTMISDVKSAVLGRGCAWPHFGSIFEKFWAVVGLVHFTMISDVKSAVLGLGWAWPHFG